ncbi:MAG: hypothetical protein RL596_2239 [Bacteroidota bacterium]|jgi:hypothetical protein
MADTKHITKTYLFIDESGDPAFYAKGKKSIVGTEGFKPLFLIGLIKVEDKKAIRQAVLNFMQDLKSDPLYKDLPCITKSPKWYLHASYDNVEIQVKFVEFLRKLEGFKFYCVIGRKRLNLFATKHNNNESEFYFDMVHHLLKGRLTKDDTFYQVFLSARDKNTQTKLKASIEDALKKDNEKRKTPIEVNYNCEIVQSKDTPELSIVDYMLWALQRYILQGEKQKRFYNALEDKYSLILDLYDFTKYKAKGESNYYNQQNKFSLEKAAEFRKDGYI